MVWASRRSVALRTFYRQILSLLYSSFFLLKLPPPARPGTTYIYLKTYCIVDCFRNPPFSRDQKPLGRFIVLINCYPQLVSLFKTSATTINSQGFAMFTSPCANNSPKQTYGLTIHVRKVMFNSLPMRKKQKNNGKKGRYLKDHPS